MLEVVTGTAADFSATIDTLTVTVYAHPHLSLVYIDPSLKHWFFNSTILPNKTFNFSVSYTIHSLPTLAMTHM